MTKKTNIEMIRSLIDQSRWASMNSASRLTGLHENDDIKTSGYLDVKSELDKAIENLFEITKRMMYEGAERSSCKCPNCNNHLLVSLDGFYLCPFCECEFYFVDGDAEVVVNGIGDIVVMAWRDISYGQT